MNSTMVHSLDTYEDWSDAAETAVHQLAAEGAKFSADDVHRMVDDSALTPAQKSAWPGAVFKNLAKAGVIEKADYGNSRIKSRQGGGRYEWRGVRR